MRPFTTAQLRILAERYCDATKRSPYAVSGLIFGDRNRKVISRLLDGGGCSAESLEQASEWFAGNWPDNTPWPISASRNGVC
jgi:hypothetical protein